jgi:predicted nucleic acid-binding protein
MKIFLDANILFSACIEGSRIAILLERVAAHAELISNIHALRETERNLDSKKPQFSASLNLLKKRVLILNRIASVCTEIRDKDKPILGGAVANRCTHLLTGDKRDFGIYYGKTIEGVKIVSPRMLADEMIREGVLKALGK